MNLESWLDQEIQLLQESRIFRTIPLRTEMPALHFCSNDYLGLSRHPALIQAAVAAGQEFGVGSGASRLVSGTFPVHHKLEEELADWYGKEAALLFNSGYQGSVGLIPALAGTGVIFSDELNHASIIDGCRLSRAKVIVYRHRDLEQLETLLKAESDRFPRSIISESVFSMEGEKIDLKSLVALKQKYQAALFLDEAHAVGIYGKEGGGLAEELGLLQEVDLIFGTFSKAAGSFGSFATGSRKLIMVLVNKARSFIFSTALPPAVAAVNREAVRLIREMKKERLDLRRKGEEVRAMLRDFGLEVRGTDSPILPIMMGEAERASFVSEALRQEGIWIQPIRPPTVPPGASRLRMTLSLIHEQENYEKMFRAFRKIMVGIR